MIKLYKSNVFGKIVTECNILPDCAGRYSELKKIQKAFPKPFLSLGDLVDRGIGSKQVLDFFMLNNYKAVLGNHEHMFINFYRNRKFYSHLGWLSLGGYETILSFSHSYKFKKKLAKKINTYTNLFNQINLGQNVRELYDQCDRIMDEIRVMSVSVIPEKYIIWLESLPLMIETENCIFTHAPLNPNRSVIENLFLGEDGSDHKAEMSVIWNRKELISRHEKGKIQFSGHNNHMLPVICEDDLGIIGLWLDCSKTQRLYCYIGSEDSIYYVDYDLDDYDHNLVARFPGS